MALRAYARFDATRPSYQALKSIEYLGVPGASFVAEIVRPEKQLGSFEGDVSNSSARLCKGIRLRTAVALCTAGSSPAFDCVFRGLRSGCLRRDAPNTYVGTVAVLVYNDPEATYQRCIGVMCLAIQLPRHQTKSQHVGGTTLLCLQHGRHSFCRHCQRYYEQSKTLNPCLLGPT